jgi:FKBP-type peptidyl-prolyl cis-trans isomerase
MRGHVVRGLDVGVRHMTLGETSTLKVRYDYAYGNFWMGPEIPPRSNINFTVELLSINGNGRILQIPWRSFLRFYRMMRR